MELNASIWRWYANANDSARNHLIEQGWFNQQNHEAAMVNDMEAMANRDIHGNVQDDMHAAVYGNEPNVPEAIGAEAHDNQSLDAESVKQSIHDHHINEQTHQHDASQDIE